MKRKGYSSASALLLLHLRAHGLPRPELEFRFAPPRRFRFDMCFREQGVAVEIDGGTWSGGRHVRGQGFARDCIKTNLAAEIGFRVLRYVPSQVESGEAVRQIERVLRNAKAAEVSFNALVKTVTRSLKEEKDPETKEVTGYHTETKVNLVAVELDEESVRMLAAIQGEGELVVEISRRQGALFKPAKKESADASH